jgi:hypothetical protein
VSEVPNVSVALRRAGHRVSGVPTWDRVAEAIEKDVPQFLDDLVDAGVLLKHDGPFPCYQPAPTEPEHVHHFHVVCQECGEEPSRGPWDGDPWIPVWGEGTT